MSPLLRKKTASKRPQTIVTLDIGSGSVGAALVEITSPSLPVILMHKRVSLKLTPQRTASDLQEKIIKSVGEAFAALLPHIRRRKISRVAAFIPAPWSELVLHKVRFAQTQMFLANRPLMNRLIAEHIKEDESRGSSPDSGHEGGSQMETVFERTVAGIRLNGYVSPSMPESAHVFRVEMMLAAARAAETFIARLHEAINLHFQDAEITLHSSSLAAAHAISALAVETPSFLLCDGEGEIAELLLVHETIPEAHATIPVGYATILRTLATHSGMTHEEILSARNLLGDSRSPLFISGQETIRAAQKKCADELGKAEPVCAAFAPRVSYLIGDGPEAGWFADALMHSPRLRSVLPHDFEVRRITAAWLAPEVTFTHAGSRRVGDAMIALQALFATDRFGASDVKFYVN